MGDSSRLGLEVVFLPSSPISPVSPRTPAAPYLPVSISHVKTHLTLLRAFYELKTKAENIDPQQLPEISFIPDLPERRWSWCVGLAVERFERWCRSLQRKDTERELIEILPPVDALMVWHAYLLNPLWYLEDARRMEEIQILREIGVGLLNTLGTYFIDDLMHSPSESRRWEWEFRTKTPWDLIESIPRLQRKNLNCPKCRNAMIVPFVSNEGVGYLQQGFSISCSKCSQRTDRNVLAVYKFVDDLTSDFPLSGTMLTPNKRSTRTEALAVKEKICKVKPFQRPYFSSRDEWIKNIMKKVDHELGSIRQKLLSELRSDQPMARRIMEGYFDDRMFSVDLAGSVLRLSSFTQKLYDIGWMEVEQFEENDKPLHDAIGRYDNFLSLFKDNQNKSLVPTLDIDLAWHTHQLLSKDYESYCKEKFNRFLDHQDKVVEDDLASKFESTSTLWKQRYECSYTRCGCPEGSSGALRGKRRSTLGADQDRPETHPSDHDMIYDYTQPSSGDRDKHIEKHRKHSQTHPIPFIVELPIDESASGDCTAISGHIMQYQKVVSSGSSMYSMRGQRSSFSSGSSVRSGLYRWP